MSPSKTVVKPLTLEAGEVAVPLKLLGPVMPKKGTWMSGPV